LHVQKFWQLSIGWQNVARPTPIKKMAIQMSNLAQITAINMAALDFRQAQEKNAPEKLRKARLAEMVAMPSYIGFVEAEFLAGLPFVMFLCDRDDGIALRLLWKREFEPASLSIWRQLVMQSSLVVDVGGHTGIYSIVAGLANPEARVHTVEPHELNFGRLLLNLRANGLRASNRHCVAASRASGTVPFSVKLGSYLSAGGRIVDDGQTLTKIVRAAPIDDLVPLRRGRVCVKIDTEGHEVEVLAGMPQLIGKGQPDIILECVFDDTMAATEASLKAAGYRFFYIDERKWKIHPLETITIPPEDLGPTERENVLITRMSADEVHALFREARAGYERARSSAQL
jgi:FkbM family methyltransferase